MAQLADAVARFFGRVEILALGADEHRRHAEAALQRHRPATALRHARALVSRVPHSPVGQALWADAAEACGLDDELFEALSGLIEHVPWRRDLALRLGELARRARPSDARQWLQLAAQDYDDPPTARSALLALFDLDWTAGEPGRALRWLALLPHAGSEDDPEVTLRRAEGLLGNGQLAEAAELGRRHRWPMRADGRERMVRARLAWLSDADGGRAEALEQALAAYVVGATGAATLLAELLASADESSTLQVERARRVIEHEGQLDQPLWSAAFALAAGEADEARASLLRLLGSGDPLAASLLLALAAELGDLAALRAVAGHAPALLANEHRALLEADRLRAEGQDRAALDQLAVVRRGPAASLAAKLEREVLAEWLGGGPAEAATQWPAVLGELREAARRLDRLELLEPIDALAVERRRPLRVALLGEFNAGKSTLVNALLGVDVAPTGVRPTTAALHWVAWAPDPFARILVRGDADRVVAHEDLKRALDELQAAGRLVERVLIYAPIERLKRIELLDTPGLNAPRAEHASYAEAAVQEAHLVVWLLDATVPLKESERGPLEAIAHAGVPIQILVNKIDRIADADVADVMAHVTSALESLGLESLRPPVALSARLALQARLGDAALLAASHWREVESLLERHVVAESDALRERALRQKAARLADELAASAEGSLTALDREVARQADRCDALAQAAEALDRARRETARGIVSTQLRAPLDALAADARPVERLPAERLRADGGVRDYLRTHTVDRLAGPLARAAAEVAARAANPPRGEAWVDELGALLAEPARAIVAGAVATSRPSGLLQPELLEPLCEAALRVFAETLRARASARSEPPTPVVGARQLATLASLLASTARAARQEA